MAGISNSKDAYYLILLDYSGYGGVSCEVFINGEEGDAVTQLRMEIAVPSSRIPGAMIAETVSQHPGHMILRAMLSVFDGYGGSPNIVNLRAKNTGSYWLSIGWQKVTAAKKARPDERQEQSHSLWHKRLCAEASSMRLKPSQ